ncbi:hypothetical protein CHCC14814_0815 [Bacillus paralicheniformis]|nr:hypothetical protein CHCC14814_0815 [Bacillus paralicheniformis]
MDDPFDFRQAFISYAKQYVSGVYITSFGPSAASAKRNDQA